jgi:uncharacterized protein YndB with AHSA1/START domain
MTAQPRTQTRAIVVEETVPHTPEIIWRVLTTREMIARWLMENDFEPGLGKSFTMKARPMGDWDGTVSCTIGTFDPPRELSYSWVGGSSAPGAIVPALDSVVTWTLTPVEGGTKVRMVHDGFVSPRNDMGYDAMSGGWANVVKSIAKVAATL